MLRRRRLVLSAAAWLPMAAAAAGLADVLARPAAPVQLSSKPAMLRIVRAGDRLVAVGERGIVLLSDDDGRSWRQGRVPVSVTLTGVQFIDPKQGWAIGHALVVLHTDDGGETWALQHEGSQVPDGLANPLLDLHFASADEGWAVGAYGTALHTGDAGRTWQAHGAALPNPKGLHLYAVARQGGRVYIAGEQGLFIGMAADARGDSIAALAAPYRGSFFTLTPLAEGGLLLGGLRGTLLLRGADGGWRTLDSGSTQAIVSCALLPQQRQALVDQSGRVHVGRAGQDAYATLPAEAERRWVAVAPARDGSLVGAGTTGVARLPAARTGT